MKIILANFFIMNKLHDQEIEFFDFFSDEMRIIDLYCHKLMLSIEVERILLIDKMEKLQKLALQNLKRGIEPTKAYFVGNSKLIGVSVGSNVEELSEGNSHHIIASIN